MAALACSLAEDRRPPECGAQSTTLLAPQRLIAPTALSRDRHNVSAAFFLIGTRLHLIGISEGSGCLHSLNK